MAVIVLFFDLVSNCVCEIDGSCSQVWITVDKAGSQVTSKKQVSLRSIWFGKDFGHMVKDVNVTHISEAQLMNIIFLKRFLRDLSFKIGLIQQLITNIYSLTKASTLNWKYRCILCTDIFHWNRYKIYDENVKNQKKNATI